MPRPSPNLIKVTIKLPKQLLKEFDDWWRKEGFVSRNEAIRQILREAIRVKPLTENAALFKSPSS